MKNIFKIIVLTIFAIFWIIPSAYARDVEDITDWYIKDFQQSIVVDKDSTMEVTEDITADCGNLPDKHGIFRTLPLLADTGSEEIRTPVELVSITDFSDQPINYEQIKDRETITWKIGDPEKTVTGVNHYRIKYRYKNVIRAQENFDEFYWNLPGNYWQIDIDHFKSVISFPREVGQVNSEIDYYTGKVGSKDKSLASYFWSGQGELTVESSKTLTSGEGITLSVSIPKGIFSPYQLTQQDEKIYLDTYEYLETYYPTVYWIINLLGLPLLILTLLFVVRSWRRFGKDPKGNDTVAPEFEIPEGLPPFEMGMVYSNGIMQNGYFAGAVVNLAVRKIISIEEVGKRNIFSIKDYLFKLIDSSDEKLSVSEKAIIDSLFGQDRSTREVKLSELRKSLPRKFLDIKNQTQSDLVSRGWLDIIGRKYQIAYFIIGPFLIAGSFFVMIAFPFLGISLAIIGLILFIFAFIMPKRTLEGWKLNQRIRGFKLYMDTAEKYRQQFNEKENIFEQLLPYAIMFGMTKKWIKTFKNIYGEKYFSSYHPYWFASASGTPFDADSLNSAISGISTSIGTASGVSGGGASGGGGGGGGGGGW